jgi:hypothetical protein
VENAKILQWWEAVSQAFLQHGSWQESARIVREPLIRPVELPMAAEALA